MDIIKLFVKEDVLIFSFINKIWKYLFFYIKVNIVFLNIWIFDIILDKKLYFIGWVSMFIVMS